MKKGTNLYLVPTTYQPAPAYSPALYWIICSFQNSSKALYNISQVTVLSNNSVNYYITNDNNTIMNGWVTVRFGLLSGHNQQIKMQWMWNVNNVPHFIIRIAPLSRHCDVFCDTTDDMWGLLEFKSRFSLMYSYFFYYALIWCVHC